MRKCRMIIFNITLALLCLVSLFLFPFILPTTKAYAEEGKFVKIETDGIYFTILRSNIKFEIPKNFYFLYTERTHENNFKGEYMGIEGYISQSTQLTIPESNVSIATPYFIYNDTVKGKANPLKVTENLFLRESPSYENDSNKIGNELAADASIIFLGTCTAGAQTYNNTSYWYCVKAGETIGYVHESKTNAQGSLTSAKINELFNEAPVTDKNEQNTYSPEAESPQNNLMRILLIIGITIPAIIIVILLFKPSKKKNNSYTWDRNIYDNNPKNNEDYDPRL